MTIIRVLKKDFTLSKVELQVVTDLATHMWDAEYMGTRRSASGNVWHNYKIYGYRPDCGINAPGRIFRKQKINGKEYMKLAIMVK